MNANFPLQFPALNPTGFASATLDKSGLGAGICFGEGAMKEIQLTQGKQSVISDVDFERINQHRWHYLKIGYAARNATENGHRKYIYMHREIMQTPDDMETDHINGNTLDNRRENLRICTRSQNSANKNKYTGASGYKGVHWFKPIKKWAARIQVEHKQICLGYFSDVLDAARAYNRAAIELFGEFARLNEIPQ
jgi:hypothetical protein